MWIGPEYQLEAMAGLLKQGRLQTVKAVRLDARLGTEPLVVPFVAPVDVVMP